MREIMQRRLGKRLLQFYELPDRSNAFKAGLNSAGSPNRNAASQKRVREFFDLMEATAQNLTPADAPLHGHWAT